MKLILSRKGFDSSAGGVANPILPDGRLIPLPIPDDQAPYSYGELSVNGEALGPLVEDLTRGKVSAADRAHLDPDIDPTSLPRHQDWRPLFGQHAAAQGHLNNEGVGVGDLFLFFGWFRQAEQREGRWRFIKEAPDQHIIYGYLRVQAVRHLVDQALQPWQHNHPHAHGERGPNNVLYWGEGGLFPNYDKERVLTEEGQNRGIWRLPSCFHPDVTGKPLSYHGDPNRWTRLETDEVRLKSVYRGQEFVVDCTDNQALEAWTSFWTLTKKHK